MTALLDLLDTPDLYSRLYPLQLVRACAEARPQRAQECIQTAPMGTSRLAAMLDDPRDMVRNEALLLLADLTRASSELQKIFVFEDVFAGIYHATDVDVDVINMSLGDVIPRNADNTLAEPTSVVRDAHRNKLVVHPFTFRVENQFLPTEFRSSADPNAPGDLVGEIQAFLDAGIDGFFTDNPDIGVRAAATR